MKAKNPDVTKSRFSSRHEVVADLLRNKPGRLIDLGSRDRILLEYLRRPGGEMRLEYYSADLEGRHDYAIDLETPLPFGNGEFDYVVILDVLEHLENIHKAFDECIRVAGKGLILSLPNMATMIHRLNFLFRGRLKTGKYDLLAEHQGDRHRWLTSYENTISFVTSRSRRNNCRISRIIGCRDFYSFSPIGILNRIYTVMGQVFMTPGLYCNTLVFEILKNEPPGN